MISRLWDKEAKQLGITDDERQRMADELKRHEASLWRSGAPSVPTVQLDALPFAIQQLTQAGCTLSKEALRFVCELPPKLIQSQAHFRVVAIYRLDAARSAAIQAPRIKRSRDHIKPMDWVAGDVHHIDITFQRDDGSLCTIKAVAWLDLATNRAYNPQSKVIETLFASLEKSVFSQLPGYIGGNRMRKKVENQGRHRYLILEIYKHSRLRCKQRCHITTLRSNRDTSRVITQSEFPKIH